MLPDRMEDVVPVTNSNLIWAARSYEHICAAADERQRQGDGRCCCLRRQFFSIGPAAKLNFVPSALTLSVSGSSMMTASGSSQPLVTRYAGSNCTGGGSGCTNTDANSVDIRFAVKDKSSYQIGYYTTPCESAQTICGSAISAGRGTRRLHLGDFSVDPYTLGMPFLNMILPLGRVPRMTSSQIVVFISSVECAYTGTRGSTASSPYRSEWNPPYPAALYCLFNNIEINKCIFFDGNSETRYVVA